VQLELQLYIEGLAKPLKLLTQISINGTNNIVHSTAVPILQSLYHDVCVYVGGCAGLC